MLRSVNESRRVDRRHRYFTPTIYNADLKSSQKLNECKSCLLIQGNSLCSCASVYTSARMIAILTIYNNWIDEKSAIIPRHKAASYDQGGIDSCTKGRPTLDVFSRDGHAHDKFLSIFSLRASTLTIAGYFQYAWICKGHFWWSAIWLAI